MKSLKKAAIEALWPPVLEVETVDPKNEYVLIKVNKNLDLSEYAVIDKTFSPNGVESNVNRHIYVFPSVEVKKGDVIYLFTGHKPEDTVDKKMNPKKPPKSIYNFYWNLDHPVWNNEAIDTAFIIRYKLINQKVISRS